MTRKIQFPRRQKPNSVNIFEKPRGNLGSTYSLQLLYTGFEKFELALQLIYDEYDDVYVTTFLPTGETYCIFSGKRSPEIASVFELQGNKEAFGVAFEFSGFSDFDSVRSAVGDKYGIETEIHHYCLEVA